MIKLDKDIIVYHGSRGGIEGEIRPISRARCDFGQGFYLGDDIKQARSLVIEDSSPYLYKIQLNLSKIPNDRIWILNGKDWLFTVLAHRKNVQEFNKLAIAKNYLEKAKMYDVIIGPIADDRMNEAMRRFEQKSLTDEGLIACLQSSNMGYQYVLKTDFACQHAKKLEERQIYGLEEEQAREYVMSNRLQVANIVEKMQIQYRNVGKYLDEIIEDEMKKCPLSEKMRQAWENHYDIDEDIRPSKIEYQGEKYNPLEFDDMYLGQCQKERIEPNQRILKHFNRCIASVDYKPKFVNLPAKNYNK